MNIEYYIDNFKIELPFAFNGIFWNGLPGEYSNIPGELNYTQKFGHTPFSKRGVYGFYNGQVRPHNGHDWAGFEGTKTVSPRKLWVTYTGFDPNGYGNFVFAETETILVNGQYIKIEFVFAHLSKITAKQFTWLQMGAEVGLMGNTGFSTGPHLHFGGRPLIMKNNQPQWLYPEDGARGYIDMAPFFLTRPVFDKQEIINEYKRMSENKPKVIKDKNSSSVGFWLPILNEEALKSLAYNFGILIPKHEDGSINWAKLIEGEFELK